MGNVSTSGQDDGWSDYRDPTVYVLMPKDISALDRARTWSCDMAKREERLGWLYLIVAGSLGAMATVFYCDITNFHFAMMTYMPELSGGDANGPLRQSIVFAFASGTLISSFALWQATRGLGAWLNKVLDLFGLLATVLLVGGTSIFLPMSVAMTTSGDSDSGGGLSGLALGLALGALYGLSVAASRAMADYCLGALARIASTQATRVETDAVKSKVDRVEAGAIAVHHADRIIDAMGKPGALGWLAAIAMTEAVAPVTSRLHERMLERELVDANGGDPALSDYPVGQVADVVVDAIRAMPLKRLQQLGQYLAKLTPKYIYDNYLEQGEI